MKTLKLAVIALALFTTSFVAKADNNKTEDTPLAQFRAVNAYVDAVAHGKVDGFDKVLDNTAKFSLLRGKKILSFDKTQMVDFLKENKYNQQGCVVSTNVVSSNADMAVVKVDMKYDGFVRSNYVTLANNGKDWKITEVYSVFK